MKKTKLLLSLAMMCLSVAVLCFGVLAATSVTYSISGTISYEVNDVFVKINTSVYGIAEQQSKADVITTVKAMESVSQANSLTINSKTYTRTQTMVEYDSSSATTDPATQTAQTSDSKGVEIVYGTYYTYYIVINIQNLSSSKTVDAIITDDTTAELNSIKTTNLYLNDVEYGTPKNIVIAYSIKDKTQGIDSTAAEIKYSLKVSYETTDYTDPIAVTNDTTNSYYYVTLGTGKSLDSSQKVTETDINIKWKLVSLDGVSKYTYNAADNFEARYLSDAVFLQETAVNSPLGFDKTTNVTRRGNANYFESEIRNGKTGQAALKDGSYFNLSSTDTNFIKERNITSINFWRYEEVGDVDEGDYMLLMFEDTSKDALYNEDNSRDKFWLLSYEETETFFEGELNPRQWKDSSQTLGVCYWLRTPMSSENGAVFIVFNGGDMGVYSPMNYDTLRIRAAFQLA